MHKELLAGGYIQDDETPVDVQTHDIGVPGKRPLLAGVKDKRGKNHQAYLWQYGTPGGSVVFDFRMSRAREGPKQFLGAFAGILQSDDYIAYERGLGAPGMVHACCWAHARRNFVDAVKLNKQDADSIRAVELIDKLFSIDAQAREEKDGSCRASHLAPGKSATLAQTDPRACSGHATNGVARQQSRSGVQIHADTLGKAHPLPRLSRAGTEQ